MDRAGAPLRQHPLVWTLFLALAGVLALQLWRPLYHLTDDNLNGLPVLVEFSRRLWSGLNPFTSESLFGGGYNHLADPGVLGLLNPLILLSSPLACSRWYYLIPDIIGSINLILIALAFCWAGLRLRSLFALQLSDAALVFLSISYAFSGFNLLVNSSWVGFINPQAAMPILLVAMYEQQRRRSILLMAGATLFALVTGHLHPFLYMCGFTGLLGIFVAVAQRSWEPLLRFAAGVALALVTVSPVLAPATLGFTTSQRQAPLSVADAAASSVPLEQLAASFALGPGATALFPDMSVHYADPSFSIIVAFSLANLPLLCALVRKRKVSVLEIGAAVGAAVAVLLITRPLWLQSLMLQLPLLRSLRWPFREIADLSFFVHLLALLNMGRLLQGSVGIGVIAAAASFGVIGLGAPPTFHPMYVDRELVLSGKAEAFWQTVRARVGEQPHVIVGSHPALTIGPQIRLAPFSLAGAYNYAALFGFVNVSGYSPTEAGSAQTKGYRPFHFGGIYWNQHAQAIWAQNPGWTLVELLRNDPAIIRVRHRQNTWVFSYDLETKELTELPLPPSPAAP